MPKGDYQPKDRFVNHQLRNRPSMSWHLNAVYADGTYCSNDAYSITWSPGHLLLAGDLDDFVVTHYSAMSTLEKTSQWLTGIGFDYLMSKSSAKEVYDAKATLKTILRMANENAIESRIRERIDLQRYRSQITWQPSWNAEDYPIPERPPSPTVKTRNRSGRVIVPDGWEIWYKLFEIIFCYGDADSIFTKQGRDQIAYEVMAEIETASKAAEFCSKIGLDDFYGCYTYPSKCHVWYNAIQKWVELVKAKQSSINYFHINAAVQNNQTTSAE
jgi:hypothetical protein